MSEEQIEELEKRMSNFEASFTEILHGSMKSEKPGLASRILRLETERVADLETRLALLEDHKIREGKVRIATLEKQVTGLASWMTKIGTAVVLAIVGAIMGVVLK